ncbi:MAG: ester cyclase [Candidatus Heimdallarchaeota archaeon]|nr:ester cyclase [Candidatus Heimdallarchaeota archaeon]
MTIERNEKIGRAWFEEMWNKPDFNRAQELIHPDFKPEYIGIPKQGPELVIHEIKYFRSAFHNLEYKITDIIANETKVWVYYKAEATHEGNTWGFEPTGMKITFEGMSILEINQDGKVINQWGAFCLYDILADLELVPPFWELSNHFPQK